MRQRARAATHRNSCYDICAAILGRLADKKNAFEGFHLMSSSLHQPAANVPLEIDVLAVKQMFDRGEDFLFLDCREPEEHALVRIAGATLIPMSELRDRLTELEPYRGRRIVVHCHHGGRSLRVAMWLRKQGFPHACSMAGGIDEWSQHIDTSIPRY